MVTAAIAAVEQQRQSTRLANQAEKARMFFVIPTSGKQEKDLHSPSSLKHRKPATGARNPLTQAGCSKHRCQPAPGRSEKQYSSISV
jgi:hypothetical protein